MGGRPKGAKDKKPRAKAPQVGNAKKARGRWANTDEREALDQAKSEGRYAAPELIRRAIRIGLGTEQGAEYAEQLRAMQLVLDRCGMPPKSEIDAALSSFPAMEIRFTNHEKPTE